MIAWWWSAVAAAGCLGRSEATTLSARLTDAEAAYAALDDEGFARSMDDVTLLLPCLGDVVPAPDAARLHRMKALQQYGLGDSDAAVSSLVAARALEPAYTFPDALLPPDHELRQMYEALDDDAGDSKRPPQPREGELVFDGTPSPRRPLDHSTLVQWSRDGQVVGTRLLQPADPLPPFDARPRDRMRLLGVSAALLAVSATSYGLAMSTHGPFWDTSSQPQRADLVRLQSESVTFTAVSVTSGVLGLGGLSLAFLWADDGKAPPGTRW